MESHKAGEGFGRGETPRPFTFKIVFSKEIVQTPTVRSRSMSEAEESSTVEEKKKLA
jgi:hypothetical protein